MVDRAAGVLRCALFEGEETEFAAESRRLMLAPGVGLAGRVWAAAAPVTIENLARDPNFVRAGSATAAGLKAGSAVPLIEGTHVVAVYEAFADVPPDPAELAARAATFTLPVLPEMSPKEKLHRRTAAQHAAIAELGRRAVTEADVDALVADAVRVVADALDLDEAGMLERAGAHHMRIRATSGFEVDIAGELIPVAGTLSGHILTQEVPVVVEDVPNDPRAAGSWILHERGVATAAGVVVRGPEEPAGVLSVHSFSPRAFSTEEIAFLRSVANVIAAALVRDRVEAQRARAYAERDRVARTLQRGLLPPALPLIPGVALGARYHAAGEEVGGDFYDVFPAPEGWMVVVGDVCGRGAEAAALTSVVRHTLRGAAAFESSPERLLHALNTALMRESGELSFCTLLCGHLTAAPAGASLRLVDGGHPLPLLVPAEGEIEPVGRAGTLVGALEHPRFEEARVELARGDTLVMFTDGLIDSARPRGDAGMAMVRQILAETRGAGPDPIAERLARAAIDAAGGQAADDVAVLVLQVDAASP